MAGHGSFLPRLSLSLALLLVPPVLLAQSVTVSPDGDDISQMPNTNGLTVDFTVHNGSGTYTYDFECIRNGPVSCDSVSPEFQDLTTNQSITVTVTYSTLSSGDALLRLRATAFDSGHEDEGWYDITVLGAPGVSVTPDGQQAADREAPGSYSETFWVKNTGTTDETFDFDCDFGTTVTCDGTGPTSQLLNEGDSVQVTLNYTVAVADTGSQTVTLLATAGTTQDEGSYNVLVIHRAVEVTPDDVAGTPRDEGTGPHTEIFTIKNIGNVQDSYTLSCADIGEVDCTEPDTTITLNSGDSTTMVVAFDVGDRPENDGSDPLQLTATSTTNGSVGDVGSYNITINDYEVTLVSTVDTTVLRQEHTDSLTDTFIITNNGSTQNIFNFTCSPGLGIDQCEAPPPDTLDASEIDTVTVMYDVGDKPAGGVGSLTLTAVSTEGPQTSDFDQLFVPITGSAAIVVTPDDSTAAEREVGSGADTEDFVVGNPGTEDGTFTVDCDAVDALACTHPIDSTISLDAGEFVTVTAHFTVGSTPDTFMLTLNASGEGTSDAGTINIPIVTYGVVVTPDGEATPARDVPSTHTETFFVENTGTANNIAFTITCTGETDILDCFEWSDTSTALNHGQIDTVTVTYNVLDRPGDGTGTLTLTASSAKASNSGTYNIPINSYDVVVTPTVDTSEARAANTDGHTDSFTVSNQGSVQNRFGFTCNGDDGVDCPTPPDSVTIEALSEATVFVTYNVDDAPSDGHGALTLTASGTNTAHFDSLIVPIVSGPPVPSVAVIPADSFAGIRDAPGTHSDTFTVVNGPTAETYTFDCEFNTSVTCVGTTPVSLAMDPDDSVQVSVEYSVAIADSGSQTVTLLALAQGGGVQDDGTWTIDVRPPPVGGVIVEPKYELLSQLAGAMSQTADFTVENAEPSSQTFTISCEGIGGVTCTSTSESSMALASDSTATVTATYNVGPTGGLLHVRASSVGNPALHDEGTYVVSIAPPISVVVSAREDAAVVFANDGLTQAFLVKNTTGVSHTYNLSLDCSGTVTACNLSPDSVQLAGGESRQIEVSFESGADSTTGIVGLIAMQSDESTATDSAFVDVLAVAPPRPIVEIETLNAGVTIARDLCLRIAIPGGSYECGDLRLAHALPSIRTLNKLRTPVLTYNSQDADPTHIIVAANVTLDAATPVPDVVEATLKVGQVEEATWSRPGSQWNVIKTRRIALVVNATEFATGVYDYDLEVKAGSSGTPTIVSGRFIVVNRRDSDFGAGWWLAGLEQLFFPADSSLLWVGGDGSARHYQKVSSDTWVAEHPSRPDTIREDGQGNYVRYLPQRVRVTFNSAGEHQFTTNRLGHETEFVHSGGRLSRIVLPSEGGDQTYEFDYDGNGKLETVTLDIAGITVRTTSVNMVNGRVASFVDPDETSISFTYSGMNPRRPRTRTDRRGNAVTYIYDGPSRTLGTATLDMAVGDDIKFEVIARRRRGIMQTNSHNADSAFTLLRLPRYFATGADNANTIAKFWLDRFGAPTRIEDAGGNPIILERHDAQYRALVTRLQSPNGYVSGAGYDHRGNIVFSTDSSTNATTTYSWDPMWDLPTAFVPPEGDRIDMAYDSTTGSRLLQQDARGAASRVSFVYYTTGNKAGLLQSVDPPVTPAYSYDYDTRGNLKSATTPLGFVTTWERDALGRDSVMRPPIDAAHHQEQRFFYDIMDRLDSTVTFGPALSYEVMGLPAAAAPAETLVVAYAYDDESNLVEVKRKARPDPESIDWLISTFAYDRAHRPIAENHNGRNDSTVYDVAGNPVERITSRGHIITMQYDTLNRLVQRVVSEVTYAQASCSGPLCGNNQNHDWIFPAYPNDGGTGLRIPADTATFTYDVMGNIITADNRVAHVTRTYHPNGALATDSVWIRQHNKSDYDFTGADAYGIAHVYDLNGRRERLTHPANLVPSPGNDQIYTYDTFGALDSVVSVLGHSYSYEYDLAGRLTTYTFPPSGSETFDYDDDGRRIERTELINGVKRHGETFTFDARGKILTVRRTLNPNPEMWWEADLAYTALGQLAAMGVQDNETGIYTGEEFRPDALNRMSWRKFRNSLMSDPPDEQFEYTWVSARLANIDALTPANPPATWFPEHTYSLEDLSGNVDRSGRYRQGWNGELNWNNGREEWVNKEGSRTYHGADERVMFRQVYRDSVELQQSGAEVVRRRGGVFEEYWYDALGRRVFLKALGEGPQNTDALCWSAFSEVCYDAEERYIWDGDQLLYEVRESSAPEEQNGWVGYTHALGVDAPLDIMRVDHPVTAGEAVIPHMNWRGHYDSGTFPDGSQFGCEPEFSIGCSDIGWPASNRSAHLDDGTREPPDWFGSLIGGQRDQSGLMYMRNRYYDPIIGQFTQEDPIGLAGGLNLYGFAGGDPINFSDPFGLCPWCVVAYGIFEVGATLYDAADLAITGVNYLRGRASGQDLAVTAAGAGFGLIGFGGGYGRGARSLLNSLDDLSAAARVADRGGLTAAGRALTKHARGQRAGSRLFPELSGGVDDINHAAQDIVDDILTNPNSTSTVLTRGRFKGGVDIFDPSGRGVRYDAEGNFVSFLERQQR